MSAERIAELLARMLPGAVDLEGVSAGVAGLTQAEWGALLAGMPRRNAVALRAAFLQDASASQELVDLLHIYAADVAIEKKLGRPPVGSRIFEIMALLAVLEVCRDEACQWCKGVAEIRDGDQVLACQACRGTGRARVNVREALGHGEPWLRCYELVRAGLNSWVVEGCEHVARRFDKS